MNIKLPDNYVNHPETVKLSIEYKKALEDLLLDPLKESKIKRIDYTSPDSLHLKVPIYRVISRAVVRILSPVLSIGELFS